MNKISTPYHSRQLFLWITLLAIGFGLVMVYSSSAIYAERTYNSATYFLNKQFIWIAIGFVSLILAANVSLSIYKKLAVPLFFVGILLCGLVLIPGIGVNAGGARRWIHLGFFGFQPSELAKIGTILYLAAILGKREESKKNQPPLLLVAVISQIPILFILLEPDFGTAIVLELMVVAMIFSAGLPFRYLFAGALSFFPLIYFMIIHSPYRLKRMLAWLFPWEFRQDLGYQVTEALISMGSGGIFGVGLGQGKQKLFFLPEAHTDFILAIIGEELGLLGILLTLSLFVFISMYGFRLAIKKEASFERFLVLGLTFLILVPAVVNFGVVLGLLPPKGLPLPLLSYGGTHILVSMIAIGILIKLSSTSNQKTGKLED